jgi:succinoglycan biosynthesis protein ExoO
MVLPQDHYHQRCAVSPDVTFVIAAYNAGATIERAIASVLAQRGIMVEVLVVDDHSTDDTVSRARSFDEATVHVVSTECNGGPSKARNVGFARAKGRWIAVLDSDDSIHPDRTAQMIARAERANAQIVIDNLEVLREGEIRAQRMFTRGELECRPILALRDFIASNLLFKSTFNFGYVKPMFKRRFMEENKLQYDESLRIGEDYILLASALASGGKCVREPVVGYCYHVRDGSLSRVLERHHVDAMIAADVRFNRKFELNPEEQCAQALRTKSLNEAAAFLSLVESIKQRSVSGVVRAACKNPRAISLLSMPISARVRRLMRFVTYRRQQQPAT